MVWNVDQSGAQRSYRIMQKRGVILDADDFLPLRQTYPEHHSSKNDPIAKTIPELKNQRLDSNRRKVAANNATFDSQYKQYQARLDKPYVYSEFYQPAQRFTSVNQRKEFERQEARKRQNLTDVVQEQKDEAKPPSLVYVDNPNIATNAVLREQRRQRMLNELKLMERNVGNHADSYARMNAREDCALRLLSKMPESKMTR